MRCSAVVEAVADDEPRGDQESKCPREITDNVRCHIMHSGTKDWYRVTDMMP